MKENADKTLSFITAISNEPPLEKVLASLHHDVLFDAESPTSIDLFSGCGGLTLGFRMAGVRSILASDIDENCEKTFRRNFPDVPFICKDITEISLQEVKDVIGDAVPDIIVGGPPCQGFSLANKRRGKIADDPRNRLFYGFVKFVNWYSPKAFVMENVKGLLSMQGGKVIKTIMEEFANAGEQGYNVAYKILRASDYGVPQNRERVVLVGFRKDLGLEPCFPMPLQHKYITVDEAIGDLPQIDAGQGSEVQEYRCEAQNEYQRLMRTGSSYVLNHIAMKHTPRLVERFKAIKPGQSLIDVWETHGSVKRGAPSEKSNIKFSQNNQRLFGDQPAPTIAASFQSNFIHPHLNRNFTAREGARLQSFPDDFVFEGMRTKMSWEKGLSQYQQIGNAVPVLMAKAIAECIKEQIQQDMNTIDKIRDSLMVIPQLCHASNIIGKYSYVKDVDTHNALDTITREYGSYLSSMLAITGVDENSVKLKVDLLNKYYNFIHNHGYDNLFSAQGKFRPTILEEFLFLLFKDVVKEKKELLDGRNVLDSGSVKAYTNIYFKAKGLQDFIQSPEIGVNEKDQDYAIYRIFDISVNNAPSRRIQIPAVAIEAKTYIDKTMLDGIIATAEKLKNGNPYTRFVAVAERYDVSLDVDPSYSRIDQIYVLRKGMKKGEWTDIDENVVRRLYNETINHLNRPWSDVQKRLEEEGVIL